MQFHPWQTMFVQLFHKGIGVEFLYVKHARLFPDALQVHHCPYHTGYTSGIANCLCARFLIGNLMAAVVVYVVGFFFSVLQALNATANRGPSCVVLP